MQGRLKISCGWGLGRNNPHYRPGRKEEETGNDIDINNFAKLFVAILYISGRCNTITGHLRCDK